MFLSDEGGDASDCSCATNNHTSVAGLQEKRGGTPEKGRDSFGLEKIYSGCDLKKYVFLQ